MEGDSDYTRVRVNCPKKVNVIDTKGSCFLCLEYIWKRGGGDDGDTDDGGATSASSHASSIIPFRLLSKHLKLVEYGGNVFNYYATSSRRPRRSSGTIRDPPEVAILLCDQCLPIMSKFAHLYQQLELITMRANDAVRNIQEVMEAADKDGSVVRKYRERVSSGGGVSADKLRKEVMEKCAIMTERVLPKVRLGRRVPKRMCGYVNEDDESQKSDEASQSSVGGDNMSDSWSQQDANDVVDAIESSSSNDTPDNSDSNDDSISENEKVTFKILPNGKRQCQVCFKIVVEGSMKLHKLTHVSDNQSFKCDYCAESFNTSDDVSHHTSLAHRVTFFIKHKDPRINSRRFNQLIQSLFQNLQIPKVSDGCWKCCFCETCNNFPDKLHVQSHVVREHLDELSPKLKELQKKDLELESSSSEQVPQVKSEPASPSTSDEDQDDLPPSPPPPKKRKIGPKSKTRKNTWTAPGGTRENMFPGSNVVYTRLSNGQLYQCSHCSELLAVSTKTLVNHILFKHRATLFLKHKNPDVTNREFESLVAAVFERLDVGAGPKDYHCMYCSFQNALRTEVYRHKLFEHMDQLVPKLNELQDKLVARKEAEKQQQNQNPENNSQRNKAPSSPPSTPPDQISQPPVPLSSQQVGPPPPPPTSRNPLLPDSEGVIKCVVCHEIFFNGTFESLRDHMGIHLRSSCISRIPCQICPSNLLNTFEFRSHTLRVHKADIFLKFKKEGTTEGDFNAGIGQLLDKHISSMEQPENGNSVRCNFCRNTFRRRNDAEIHLVYTHMEELGKELGEMQSSN